MSVLVAENVVKQYSNHRALDGVSVQVREGSIFGLLGPNGAGKTTLIRIINQITAPDSGTVSFMGHPLQADDIYKIGYLPEERGLYKKMKVGEQALYLAQLKGIGRQQATKELKEWFVKFGIQAWWNKKVEELSKGMAQKVQFITTVLHRPKLLILDEPFSGFDPVNVHLVRQEILRLKAQGTSIILSTHNMESVEELCDDIALIHKSKVVVHGGVDEIRHRHGDDKVEIVYRAGEILSPAIDLPQAKILSSDEHKGSRRAVIALQASGNLNQLIAALLPKVDLVSVNKIIPSMNEIFIKLVS